MGTLSYIKNFISDHKVASITPTSKFTTEKVCDLIDFSKDIRIIEYGPGDGVITRKLLEELSPGSEIMAIETNKNFVKELRKIKDKRFTIIHASAEDVEKIALKKEWASVDYIVSGIPFSLIKEEVKQKILSQSSKLLTKEGFFLVYQTTNHLKPLMRKHFKEIKSTIEFLNIPPLCIYVARKK